MIQVLVEARSAITRAGLEALVRADSRFSIAGEGYRAGDLLRTLREYTPDIVLLDSASAALPPSLNAVLQPPDAPAIVLLVASLVRAEVRRSLQSGVRGILLREAAAQEVLSALESAAAGLTVVAPEVIDALLPAGSDPRTSQQLPLGEPLTGRESEILALLAGGAGNKEIAAHLHISEHTVKFHVSSILAKLGAATRTEAVSRGYREGLIVL